MHKCTYTDRIEIQYGRLTRIVTALWKDKKADVLKDDEESRVMVRYVYFNRMAGYLVSFPHEVNNCCGAKWEQRTQAFSTVKTLSKLYCHNEPSENDIQIVLSRYPDFAYVVKKYDFSSNEQLMSTLKLWKKHPEIELLLASGLENLAWNPSFYRMKERDLKAFLSWIHVNRSYIESIRKCSFSCLKSAVKNKVPCSKLEGFSFMKTRLKKTDMKCFSYLEKKNLLNLEGIYKYKEYLNLLKEAEKTNDDYWLYPGNIDLMTEKLKLEIKCLQESHQIEKENNYKKTVSQYDKLNAECNGYRIYIPQNFWQWNMQAESLSQCIVRCNYIDKVIKKECVLIFIEKEGKPVATCQVMADGKIGEFYADEKDRSNCKPDEMTKKAFKKWILSTPFYTEKTELEAA